VAPLRLPAARLSDAPLPAPDLTLSRWPADTIVVDGTALCVRPTAGPAGAEPALYVHGLGGSSTNWTDLAALLAGQVAGLALDLPGFGWSDPAPRGSYSLGMHARTVVRLVEQHGRGPVHLFGNSMGGAIAMLVAARRPDLVRTLTLVSPAVPDLRPRAAPERLMPLLLMPGASRLIERRLAVMDPTQRVRQVLELCYGDPSLVPPHRLAEAVADATRRASLPWAMTAFARSLRGLVAAYLPGAGSLWRLAAGITAPTLVVWGELDRLVDVALAPRTAQAIRGARLLVLPGVGHVAMMEDPVTVARAFLALREDTQLAGTAQSGEPPGSGRPGRKSYGRLSG
jgi:pimeloyl-ACP methyl ester carboxylesterase